MFRKKHLHFQSQKITVPGDKSLSHRFVLFSSLAKGKSECTGFLEAEDPLQTMECFASLGVRFTKKGAGSYTVDSSGVTGFVSPKKELDFGNGGTGIRLSCGLIAGVDGIEAVLTGDTSLQKRPMDRILDPLRLMGADVSSIPGGGKAPLKVRGKKLVSSTFKAKIASAQVKSCMIFAALASGVELDYDEPELSRDHTENMLRFLGIKVHSITKTHFKISPPYDIKGTKFSIPGDISSASFFIVLGLLGSPESRLIIENIGLNPSRVGILEALEKMGARISILNKRTECGELTGDLEIQGSELTHAEIPESLIPSIIDEIPILTIAGIFAKGGFSIRNAEELRAKESDRIHSMVVNLKKLGIDVKEYEDGYEFGTITELNTDVEVETFMDHRIAMSFTILNKVAGLNIKLDDASWVETSFPNFFPLLDGILEDFSK
jgi:3-phosphoshikimate 1-carboxyvinyltransferase